MQGWGVSCRGGVGNGGVCHAGVGTNPTPPLHGSSRSEVGHVGVGWGWSCRGGVGCVM